GVGQSELEISTICDSVVLTLMPESGDAVQTIKASILEIADVFVINKVDLGGAEKTRRLIQDAMTLGPKQAWRPPVVMASAAKEEGIDEVWDAILAHQAFLKESGALTSRRQQRVKQEVVALVAERARGEARRLLDGGTVVGRHPRANRNGKLDPSAQGQAGLSVAFDMPTLMGYDSDDPLSEGEVGHCGVAIDSLEDMETLFSGIRLDQITTSMTINSPAAILYAMYIAVGEKEGLAP